MIHKVFAFGSNLSVDQMGDRCPGARVLGTALLRNHRLVFVGHSARWGGAVASVEPAPGERVPGLVYGIDDNDLARLDRFEGAPFVYQRVRKNVLGPSKRAWRVQTYELEAPCGAPSKEYFGQILRSYRMWGFDAAGLADAVMRADTRPRVLDAARRAAVAAKAIKR